MFGSRLARAGLLLAALAFTAAPARAADSVRPEVGRPLQEAQKLSLAGKHRAALEQLRAADNVAGKTTFEAYQVERVRAAAAAAAGDNPAAIKAFEAVLASDRLPVAEARPFRQGLASLYYRAGDWPKAIGALQRALQDGDSAALRELLAQAYYLNGNYAAAARQLQTQPGGPASESQWQILANSALKQNDLAGYLSALEKLASAYPKKSYWSDLLGRLPAKPGFSARLGLDVARLKLAHGLMSKPSDFMEAGQLALLAGNPAEAAQIVAQGYRSGALGIGPDAARHQRLRDLAAKTQLEQSRGAAASAAELLGNKDGDGLAALGFALVSQGAAGQGLALMRQALQMPNLRHAAEAKLHLGIALARAGQRADALAAFQRVPDTDGAADLARCWIAQLNTPR